MCWGGIIIQEETNLINWTNSGDSLTQPHIFYTFYIKHQIFVSSFSLCPSWDLWLHFNS